MARLQVNLGSVVDCRLQRVESNFVGRDEVFIEDIDRRIISLFLRGLRLANIREACASNCFLTVGIRVSSWHFRSANDLNLLALRHKRLAVVEVNSDAVLDAERVSCGSDVLERGWRFVVGDVESKVPHILPGWNLSAPKFE